MASILVLRVRVTTGSRERSGNGVLRTSTPGGRLDGKTTDGLVDATDHDASHGLVAAGLLVAYVGRRRPALAPLPSTISLPLFQLFFGGTTSNIIHPAGLVVFASHRLLVVVTLHVPALRVEVQPGVAQHRQRAPSLRKARQPAPAPAAVPQRTADAAAARPEQPQTLVELHRLRADGPRRPDEVDVVDVGHEILDAHPEDAIITFPIYSFPLHRRHAFSHPGRVLIRVLSLPFALRVGVPYFQ
mmetsp:Transcript_8990/g.26116  ORF Transcript_8990/g.26116 Transcript_8990/m.26116 type:complete len:244 (-) Transcript_8990:1345-2076(-)